MREDGRRPKWDLKTGDSWDGREFALFKDEFLGGLR